MPNTISKDLLNVIACPVDKSDLKLNKPKTHLVCTKCKREYEIKNGIPVLLSQDS